METLTGPITDSRDLAGGISKRVLRLVKAQVEDWYDVCRHLADWEDQNLVGSPSIERLSEHAALLNELERVGHWLELTTSSQDFPDGGIAELVSMTLKDLRDARALWHGNGNAAHRKEIMSSVFDES